MRSLTRLAFSLALLGTSIVLPASLTHAGEVDVGVSIGVRLPRGAVRVSVGRERYHFHDGRYYRHTPRGYVIVRPPHGARVRVLPRTYTRVVIGGTIYYRDADVYYRTVPGGYYEVCPPPVVVVQEAPPPPAPPAAPAAPVDASDYLQCQLGNERYFFRTGMFFQKSDRGYVLVEPPIGAMAEHLPGDSISVSVEGVEYFQSGDMLFKQTRDGFIVAGKR